MKTHSYYLDIVTQMAKENVESGRGGPFAAIVVRKGEIISRGYNRVEIKHDPTAHAELDAIRKACRVLGTTQLTDCILYASGEPCPMCTGAIYWTRLGAVFFACSKKEAAEAGFPDPLGSFYQEMKEPPEKRTVLIKQMATETRLSPFIAWLNHNKEG